MTTIMMNGVELHESMFAPELWAGLLAAAGKVSESQNAKQELDAFVADAENVEFLKEWRAAQTVKAELDTALETVKTLRAAWNTAIDSVNAKHGDKAKTYSHLVAVTTATAPVITGRVSAGGKARKTGNGTGTGRSTSKWELTVDGTAHSWKSIAEDILGITPPAGNYNARRRIVDAYNASKKDPDSAVKTYGVALDSGDMSRIVIANSDKVSADDLAEMMAIGCKLA